MCFKFKKVPVILQNGPLLCDCSLTTVTLPLLINIHLQKGVAHFKYTCSSEISQPKVARELKNCTPGFPLPATSN